MTSWPFLLNFFVPGFLSRQFIDVIFHPQNYLRRKETEDNKKEIEAENSVH